LTGTVVQNPQTPVLPFAYDSPEVLAVATKPSSNKSLSSERSVKTLKESSRIPPSGSARTSKEVPPGPASRHQVDSSGQEASVSNPEEPATQPARGSSQVLPKPSWPGRRCQSPMDLSMSDRPTSKKPRFSKVESVINVVERVPMGKFGCSSTPDAINDAKTDEIFASLPAIWSRDQIQDPMSYSLGGEAALPGYPGLDPVPPSTSERWETPERVRPKIPRKRGEWVSEVPLSKSVHDSALLKARQRNVLRLKRANEKDWDTLSKYLPSDVSSFFPFGLEGPDDHHDVSEEWLSQLLEVSGMDCPVPSRPPFRFETNDEALAHNSKYLEDCGWCLSELFRRNRGTTIDHGSEFRPISQLRRVVGSHPNFQDLEKMFTHGFEYVLKRELTEAERVAEVEAQLERGNHKSATKNEEEVQSLLAGDVKHGFVLPIQVGVLRLIKGLHLQPGGMVTQLSLKADGSRKEKNRFTHDLSFSLTTEDASINSRVDMTKYVDMVYGWCFSRILHYLSALRFRNPGVKIFISKFDYSDAYKRISQSPQAAAATVIRFGKTAYLCWRMVFGGAPNPAGFSCFSEMLTDLGNELAMSRYSPVMGTSPTVEPSHTVVRETEDPGEPVSPAILPGLQVPTRVESYRDCFIDDIIDCHLDTPQNRERAPHIVQLAVHVMSRPHAGEQVEPIPRRPLLGPDKLEAEGRSSERQIVLGWEIRTRSFQVHLPYDKYTAWRSDMAEVIAKGAASQEATESMIGRLNHASYVIPLSRHFLNELRQKSLSIPRHQRQTIRFSKEELADLSLWQSFLDMAHQGMSINLLVLRTPTRVAWSDSCPFGIGGYTLQGNAWRVRVPTNCPFYGDDSVNNVLEFLGMAISVLLLIDEAQEDEEKFPCLLVLGDNTSAISWLFKSGRVPRSSRYYHAVKLIARHVALKVTTSKSKLCSQHLAGVSNKISDLLSFEGTCRSKVEPLTADCPPNNILTSRIHQFHSQIVPVGFEIHQLPNEIESFVVSVMQIVAKSWRPERKPPTSDEIDTGDDGAVICSTQEWTTTPSSIRYPTTERDSFWQEDLSCTVEPSTLTDKVELLQSVRDPWYRRLFEMPLAAWHRRSGNVEGPAPSTSRTESMMRDRFTPESEPY